MGSISEPAYEGDHRMVTDIDQVIVETGECACRSVHINHIHHRNFPEIWAECGTAAEGAAHLCNLLARELDAAGDSWHRESIREALADVQAYIDALGRRVQGPSVEEQHTAHRGPTALACPTERVGKTCLRTSAAPECATARALGRTQCR